MEKRAFKNKVYTVFAEMIKAMANSHRLEIVDLLSQSEMSVEELAKATDMSIANASQHLQVLKAARIVEMRREKNFILYRLAGEDVYACWKNLRTLGMGLFADIDKLMKDFRHGKQGLEPIQLEELTNRLRSRNVVLLDVRTEKEYKMGHIPRAINMPVELLLSRLESLPKNKEYIAYCRGPFCVFADEAVDLLSREGYRARRLTEGFPDWKLKGLDIEITH